MQVKKRITSIRTCLYSNKEYNKQDLIRFVKINNKLVIDKKGNMPGRGFYLKPTEQALNDSKLIQILSKKTHSDVSEELINELKK